MEMMKVQKIILNFMKMFRVVSFWRSNTCYGVWDFFMGIVEFGFWVSFGEIQSFYFGLLFFRKIVGILIWVIEPKT